MSPGSPMSRLRLLPPLLVALLPPTLPDAGINADSAARLTSLQELALEAERRFHAIARSHPDLKRLAAEEVFLAVAVTDASTIMLAAMTHPPEPGDPLELKQSLREDIDRAASEGRLYSLTVLLEPADVLQSLELVGVPPAVRAETEAWMAKPVPAKMMRFVAVCGAQVVVFYQGDVIGLVENRC